MTDEEMKKKDEDLEENEFYVTGGPAPTIYGKSAFVTSIAGGTGGTVYSPATGITTTTGSSGSTSSSFGSWMTSSTPPPKKIVGMPAKITKKVLVAFLDDDDDPVWAKKLVPVTMNIYWEDSEDAPRMTLDLSLEDKHGNEK